MADRNKVAEFGPRPIDTYTVAARGLMAFVGAFLGGIVLALIYLFYGMDIFYTTDGLMPLLFFLAGSLVFTLITNLPAVWLQMVADREKFFYERADHMKRVFVINIFVFVLFASFYFGALLFDPSLVPALFLTQFFVAAAFSSLTLDAMAGFRFIMQAIWGTILGLFLAVIFLMALWQASFMVFVLLGLPVMWFALAFGNALLESIAHQIYIMYGVNMFEVKASEKRGDSTAK